MPSYEFECANGHRFTVAQSIKDPLPAECRESDDGMRCRAQVRQVFTPPLIQFKGDGWASRDR